MFALLQYLALSPLLLGAFISTPVEARSIGARSTHASLARRLSAANQHSEFNHIRDTTQVQSNKRRNIKKRKDGKTCKIRGTSSTTVASTSAQSTSSYSSVAAASSSASASAFSSALVTGTSSVYVPSSASSSSAADITSQSTTVVNTPAPSVASSTSAAAATSAAVTSTPGSGATTNTGSGLGLAWPNGDWASAGEANYVGNYIGSKTSWYYNWNYQSCSKADSLGLEYIPMMWGSKDANSGFTSSISGWPSATKHVLFFNEPNEGSQSNIGAQDAVQYWKQYMSPLKAQGYLIGMAATTSAPSGLQWVLDFKAACPECWAETDFVPIHYYDVDTTVFKKYVQNYYDHVQKPIWVTEYACQNFNGGAQCSTEQTNNFHYEMTAWFQAQSFVERFSPFGAMQNMQGVNEDNALMTSGGDITSLGSWYIYNA